MLHPSCFASDQDASTQKYIEKLKDSKMTQKNGVKYFDHAKFWEEEEIDIVSIEGALFETGHEQSFERNIRTKGRSF
jgi:hypothetical protein